MKILLIVVSVLAFANAGYFGSYNRDVNSNSFSDQPQANQFTPGISYASSSSAGNPFPFRNSYAPSNSHAPSISYVPNGPGTVNYEEEYVPVIKDGVPIDTPEVQRARAEHFALYAKAAEAAAKATASDGIYDGDYDEGRYQHGHSQQIYSSNANSQYNTAFHHRPIQQHNIYNSAAVHNQYRNQIGPVATSELQQGSHFAAGVAASHIHYRHKRSLDNSELSHNSLQAGVQNLLAQVGGQGQNEWKQDWSSTGSNGWNNDVELNTNNGWNAVNTNNGWNTNNGLNINSGWNANNGLNNGWNTNTEVPTTSNNKWSIRSGLNNNNGWNANNEWNANNGWNTKNVGTNYGAPKASKVEYSINHEGPHGLTNNNAWNINNGLNSKNAWSTNNGLYATNSGWQADNKWNNNNGWNINNAWGSYGVPKTSKVEYSVNHEGSYGGWKGYDGPQHVPVLDKYGVPVETLEVQIAKQEHLQAHNKEKLKKFAQTGGWQSQNLYNQQYASSHGLSSQSLFVQNGVPEETPEVKIAKAQHLAAHAEEQAKHVQWVAGQKSSIW